MKLMTIKWSESWTVSRTIDNEHFRFLAPLASIRVLFRLYGFLSFLVKARWMDWCWREKMNRINMSVTSWSHFFDRLLLKIALMTNFSFVYANKYIWSWSRVDHSNFYRETNKFTLLQMEKKSECPVVNNTLNRAEQ